MRSLSSSAEVGSCMQNSLVTEWKASLRCRKVMLQDLDLFWQSLMKARLVWVMKSVAILGRAPHW
eukprot:1721598-Pyramimonas_sp.AAC.1